MTARDRDEWEKGTRMGDQGFDVKPPAVRLHSKTETAKHAHVKLALARAIQDRGRKWDTEVRGPDGRVDVLDFGPVDSPPVVYEVQTDVTDADKAQKREQYVEGTVVRDVIFVDPTDAPDDIHALDEWADRQVTG